MVYYESGKRKRETCADLDVLKARADEVLDDIKSGVADSVALKASERNEYKRASEAVAPTGIPLDVAATHFGEAFKILGSDLVIVAAQEYRRRHLAQLQKRTVAEAVREFLDDKERQKRSRTHISRLGIHLERFANSARQLVSSVVAADIDLFLDTLKDEKGRPVGERQRATITRIPS